MRDFLITDFTDLKGWQDFVLGCFKICDWHAATFAAAECCLLPTFYSLALVFICSLFLCSIFPSTFAA
jgi:hypothetical protein